MQKRGSETALILTLMKPPIAGDEQGLIQKFMMGRKKGRRVVGREDWMEEVALAPSYSAADSDPHSTVVMLRRTPSSSFRNSPASVTMLKGAAPSSASSSAASSKWRLPLLCLLLTALAVAVVAPALVAFSGRDRDPRSSSPSSAVDNAAPVSDDSGRWTGGGRDFRHSDGAFMRIDAVTRDFSIAPLAMYFIFMFIALVLTTVLRLSNMRIAFVL